MPVYVVNFDQTSGDNPEFDTLQVGDIAGGDYFEVEADGFLYNMVRNLVGSLVEVGRGRREPSWIAQVLAARDRKLAGMTAPPQGLFLVNVDYGW